MRAAQVWQRLLGCYGESLLRKFESETPPLEWQGAIAQMNDYQLQQGMRRMLHSGKPHPPSLPEFVKLCRTVGHLDDVPDRSSLPKLPALPGGDFDKWDIASNNRLLSYVLRAGTKHRYFDPEQTRILVALKNRWAELMQNSAVDDEVPAADQQSAWVECMRMAESEIAKGVAA